MRPALRLAVLALAIANIGSAALARDIIYEQEIEHRKLSTKKAERMLQRFAKCVVSIEQRRPQIDHFLRLSPSDPAFKEAGRKLAPEQCVPSSVGYLSMNFSPRLLRSAFYDAIYLREFGKAGPPAIVAKLPVRLEVEFIGGELKLDQNMILMRTMGDCVARVAQAQVHALLLQPIGSKGEVAALNALMPILGGCVQKDSQIQFSRLNLRGMLAEAMYKLSAPAQGSITPQEGATRLRTHVLAGKERRHG